MQGKQHVLFITVCSSKYILQLLSARSSNDTIHVFEIKSGFDIGQPSLGKKWNSDNGIFSVIAMLFNLRGGGGGD